MPTLLAPDCSNAVAARAVLVHCLGRWAAVGLCERVGADPSPTTLLDGVLDH